MVSNSFWIRTRKSISGKPKSPVRFIPAGNLITAKRRPHQSAGGVLPTVIDYVSPADAGCWLEVILLIVVLVVISLCAVRAVCAVGTVVGFVLGLIRAVLEVLILFLVLIVIIFRHIAFLLILIGYGVSIFTIAKIYTHIPKKFFIGKRLGNFSVSVFGIQAGQSFL